MTTTVMIANKGPTHSIKVEVQGRNAQGHFEQVAEHTVAPNQFTEVYVYPGQSFQVIELPAAESGG